MTWDITTPSSEPSIPSIATLYAQETFLIQRFQQFPDR
jgi:hypothetical protein